MYVNEAQTNEQVVVRLRLISPARSVTGRVAAIAAYLSNTDGHLQDLYCRHDVMSPDHSCTLAANVISSKTHTQQSAQT